MNLDETGATDKQPISKVPGFKCRDWASLLRLGGYGEGDSDDAEGVWCRQAGSRGEAK